MSEDSSTMIPPDGSDVHQTSDHVPNLKQCSIDRIKNKRIWLIDLGIFIDLQDTHEQALDEVLAWLAKQPHDYISKHLPDADVLYDEHAQLAIDYKRNYKGIVRHDPKGFRSRIFAQLLTKTNYVNCCTKFADMLVILLAKHRESYIKIFTQNFKKVGLNIVAHLRLLQEGGLNVVFFVSEQGEDELDITADVLDVKLYIHNEVKKTIETIDIPRANVSEQARALSSLFAFRPTINLRKSVFVFDSTNHTFPEILARAGALIVMSYGYALSDHDKQFKNMLRAESPEDLYAFLIKQNF